METEPSQIKRADVGAVILETLSRVEVMGANDSEKSRLISLLEQYQEGQISAEDALRKADEAEKSKLDYH